MFREQGISSEMSGISLFDKLIISKFKVDGFLLSNHITNTDWGVGFRLLSVQDCMWNLWQYRGSLKVEVKLVLIFIWILILIFFFYDSVQDMSPFQILPF